MPPARTHFCEVAARVIGALLDAGEDVLELHHAGIGEHQRRIVARHQRARGDALVALGDEIIEEMRPDLVHAAHQHFLPWLGVTGTGPAGQCAGMLPTTKWRARDATRAHRSIVIKPCIVRLAPLSSEGDSSGRRGAAPKRNGRPEAAPASLPTEGGGYSSPSSSRRHRRAAASNTSPSRPELSRTPFSIVSAMPGLSLRNWREFSRPWPRRWLS